MVRDKINLGRLQSSSSNPFAVSSEKSQKSSILCRRGVLQLALLFLAISCSFFPSGFCKNHSPSVLQTVETVNAVQCFFIPPNSWEVADPRSLSPKVKIAFLKNTGKGFCPSINLAIEETDASLTEYLKAVRSIHEQDRSNHWRMLGKVRTGAGLAQLTEIDSMTEWGAVRLLQLIFVKEGSAYVLTAAALKEDFPNYYKVIQSAFRSFTLSNDLFANIPQLEQRELLKQKQSELFSAAQDRLSSISQQQNLFEDQSFREKNWVAFQKAVLDNFSEMGAYWQILVLRSAYEKLLSLKAPEPKMENNIIQNENQDPR